MNDKRQNNREKKSLCCMITNKIRLPSDLLDGEFRAEMRGRRSMYIYGCKRILKYSSEEMIVVARACQVKVLGEGLVCSFFYGGSMAIEGEIRGFFVLDKDNGGV